MATINIRPTSGVYATYRRLSYQPWSAIAEFVDNSTQSYFDHRDALLALTDFSKLRVDIYYENAVDGNDVLTITDSAFGMEWEDFERAIVLDKIPENTDGRNEFGMGLKTAACWFGRKWSVISTQLGSEHGYSATIDVDKLQRDKDEEIEAYVFETAPDEHYTIIRVERLNKKLTASRTIGKIKELLSSIYRQDIKTGEVIITYNGTELTYMDPIIFEEKSNDGSLEKWRTEIEFTINHEGRDLSIKGFIAIRIPASLRDAGFTLIRRGRVIVGGPEKNYRPNELFGDPNSYAYQRLFGELHMDNWPVTQAKDDFDWHTDGLEEQFIDRLSEYSKPFRVKAEQIRIRQRVETNDVIRETVEGLQRAGVIQDASSTPIESDSDKSPNRWNINPESSITTPDTNDLDDQPIESAVETGLIISGPSTYEMPFEYMGSSYVFYVEFETASPLSPWVTLNSPQDGTYIIRVNMKHPFFKPFIDNKEFTVIMTKLVIAMILAEVEAVKISFDERIDAGAIRNKMNKILQDLAAQT